MGRDILATTALREEKIMARAMNCEIDHLALAHFIETVKNLENNEVFTLRVCKKHASWRFKNSETLSLVPIIEGKNNEIHPSDPDQKADWAQRARQTEETLAHFERTKSLYWQKVSLGPQIQGNTSLNN